MTAPASIPALIAEGRRLIAAATADRVFPLKKQVVYGYNTLTEDDGTPLARADADGCAYVEDCAVDVVAFAVAHLPALLDVAEAGDKIAGYLEEEMLDAKTCVGQYEVTGEPCGWHEMLLALDSALSRLRGVRT